jgi:hypothetical protein
MNSARFWKPRWCCHSITASSRYGINPLRHQPGLHRENRRSLATLYSMLNEALILSIPDRV